MSKSLCFKSNVYVLLLLLLLLQGSSSEAVVECSTMAYPLLFRYKKHRRKKVSLGQTFLKVCSCPNISPTVAVENLPTAWRLSFLDKQSSHGHS